MNSSREKALFALSLENLLTSEQSSWTLCAKKSPPCASASKHGSPRTRPPTRFSPRRLLTRILKSEPNGAEIKPIHGLTQS